MCTSHDQHSLGAYILTQRNSLCGLNGSCDPLTLSVSTRVQSKGGIWSSDSLCVVPHFCSLSSPGLTLPCPEVSPLQDARLQRVPVPAGTFPFLGACCSTAVLGRAGAAPLQAAAAPGLVRAERLWLWLQACIVVWPRHSFPVSDALSSWLAGHRGDPCFTAVIKRVPFVLPLDEGEVLEEDPPLVLTSRSFSTSSGLAMEMALGSPWPPLLQPASPPRELLNHRSHHQPPEWTVLTQGLPRGRCQ